MHRTRLAAALAATLSAAAAAAAEQKPFTPEAFAAAQAANAPIVVEVYAPWCPICARQQPTLKALEANPAYDKVQVFRIDFDHQSDAVRSVNATMQSTLIAYHGRAEKARLVGVTKRDRIEELVASSLN